MPRTLALILALVPAMGTAAAEPPISPPQKTEQAGPVLVSPDRTIPFKRTTGVFVFDTGDYLLGDVQGLARSRGFFTMGDPSSAGAASVPLNTNSGHCFRQFGYRRR
jgi:hypothetical protein